MLENGCYQKIWDLTVGKEKHWHCTEWGASVERSLLPTPLPPPFFLYFWLPQSESVFLQLSFSSTFVIVVYGWCFPYPKRVVDEVAFANVSARVSKHTWLSTVVAKLAMGWSTIGRSCHLPSLSFSGNFMQSAVPRPREEKSIQTDVPKK